MVFVELPMIRSFVIFGPYSTVTANLWNIFLPVWVL